MLPDLESALRTQPLAAIPLLFGAGLATSLTPCVYPMIPITAGILGGAGVAGGAAPDAKAPRGPAVIRTVAYVSGLAMVYATLGLIAGLSGSLFGAISSNRWSYFVAGNLLLLCALAFLDVFRIAVPSSWLARANRISARSPLGAFAMGAVSGLVVAPCGAPAFAAVLTFVAATGSGVWGFIYLFVFSLGMTALLVAVGLSASTLAALPRSGPWMLWIKRAAAVLLLGMAEYYFIRMGLVS